MSKRNHTEVEDDESAEDGAILRLNVGGTLFTTTYATVRVSKGSYLERLVAKNGFRAPMRDADGAVFVDRDPETFKIVLDFLRRGSRLALQSCTGELWLRLWDDAEFYGLDALTAALRGFRNVDFGAITFEQASAFCVSAADLIRAGFSSGNSSVSMLSKLAADGVTVSDLGPGISLDKLEAAGFDWRQFYGIKVKLSGIEVVDSLEGPIDPDDEDAFGFIARYDSTDSRGPYGVILGDSYWFEDNSDKISAARSQSKTNLGEHHRLETVNDIVEGHDVWWYQPRALMTAE